MLIAVAAVPMMVLLTGCSSSTTTEKKAEGPVLRKLSPDAKNAGFLSSYDNLKQNPTFENTLSYVKQDDAKNIHKYFAVVVDPVQIYCSTNADISKVPDRGRTALAAYFQNAIVKAMGDAFPVVNEPGPLVLRLRMALIGIDVGAKSAEKGDDVLENAIDIGKVGVEMELVDSVSGEQIAAAVDTQKLGAGAVVGAANFTRDEKFAAAKEAFDGWAARMREFVDSAHEVSAADAQRADASYRPYGQEVAKK
jgi:hypothetical protein